MKYSCVADSRGRVTVPRELRRGLGSSAGVRVAFIVEGEEVVLRYLGSADVFKRFRVLPDSPPDDEK
jgi:bifunctional DNA-binding transcriptional regulator/antitoxin component of YhaV-PrlF toxin-antitoxin module